jgi:hypothetical protein
VGTGFMKATPNFFGVKAAKLVMILTPFLHTTIYNTIVYCMLLNKQTVCFTSGQSNNCLKAQYFNCDVQAKKTLVQTKVFYDP